MAGALQTATTAAATAVISGPNDPSQQSSEYKKMAPKWELITDILAGLEEIQKKPKYLPKYQGENMNEYDRRRNVTPWRPEFESCLRDLAAKPFTKDVGLKSPTSKRYAELAEDIDGRGNSLTSFARAGFAKGIAKGLHAILVDYPDMHKNGENPNRPVTIREERESGARPYWLHVEADDILALYTTWVKGKEVISHIRIRETFVERKGFGEKTGTRIRVYEEGRWEVWEKGSDEPSFKKTSEGEIKRAGIHTSIPIVLFFTGVREGEMLVKPPLLDLAHMQIELYRALSREDEVLTFASSPMLTANGMKKPSEPDTIYVGPKTILYANGQGASWQYINPDPDNIEQIRQQVSQIQEDMRRLGMQPLVERTGRVTATSDSISAARAHSAVQAWAIDYKDVLEQAFVFTAEWLGESDKAPEVSVYTDFSAIPASKEPLAALATARATGDLSRPTLWQGLQRFDILPPDFDADKEEERLKQEELTRPKPPAVPKRDPVTGEAVPAPTPGNPAPAA